MKDNMGLLDRLVRAILGGGIFNLYLYGQISGVVAVILGVIAGILLVTGIIGYSPTYHLMGISTVRKSA